MYGFLSALSERIKAFLEDEMSYIYTKEQQEFKDKIREFALKEVAPDMDRIDREAEYPLRTVKMLGELGYLGMPFPKEYGGGEIDYLRYVMAVEEMSKICPSHGVIIQTHNALCCWPIFTYGTEEQKRKYLPKLLRGEHIGCFGLTEPNAGTDAAMQQTIAVDCGDHWVLNGSKMFISGGAVADVAVVMAMTDKSKGTKGISAFIVEKTFPGFYTGKTEDKMGIRGSTVTELVFDDCIVPKENLLGEQGKGFKVAMSSLDVGRLGIAAQALGIAQGAFDMTVEYMKMREQFGKNLSKYQALAFEMATLKTKIEGARLLLYNAAEIREKGLPNTTETAAMAKLACSEVAMEVTTKAVQFHGGYGYIKDLPIERFMRDAKITQIYEGTSQVMKLVISGNIFAGKKKEAKEPCKFVTPAELAAVLKAEKGEVICSGGRGLRKTGNFEIIEQLAKALSGSVGASRGAVAEGWIEEAKQVGMTGRKVTPHVYVACGISGMMQHLAGIAEADIVVAINKNAEAPIFAAADYGIVGDLYEIIPQIIENL